MSELTDTSLMPFGVHQNEQMANVPDKYLLWIWGENSEVFRRGKPTLRESTLQVMNYIQDSFEDLP
jgi:uncharacterized protein (DUF3820 family)